MLAAVAHAENTSGGSNGSRTGTYYPPTTYTCKDCRMQTAQTKKRGAAAPRSKTRWRWLKVFSPWTSCQSIRRSASVQRPWRCTQTFGRYHSTRREFSSGCGWQATAEFRQTIVAVMKPAAIVSFRSDGPKRPAMWRRSPRQDNRNCIGSAASWQVPRWGSPLSKVSTPRPSAQSV